MTARGLHPRPDATNVFAWPAGGASGEEASNVTEGPNISTDTRGHLLERVRNTQDHDAWEQFTSFYQPIILRYARALGCSPDMCRDIVQETLVDLLTIMPRFTYDRSRGRFRAFLREIVRRRAHAAFRRRKRYISIEVSAEEGWPASLAAEESSDQQQAWDMAWQRQVVVEAMARLQKRVKPSSYEAFRAYVVAGETADDVCSRFSLTANALYQIRHRLLASLRQIAADIEREFGEEQDG